MKVLLERLWRTGEILLQKPDLASERQNALHYLAGVFPDVLPLLDARVLEAWTEACTMAGTDGCLAREGTPAAVPQLGDARPPRAFRDACMHWLYHLARRNTREARR